MAKSVAQRKGNRPRRAAAKGGSRGYRGQKRAGAMVLHHRNYVLMLIGVFVIVLGYLLMRIDNQFEGFISIYLAPILLLGGYLEIIYAILWHPDEASQS